MSDDRRARLPKSCSSSTTSGRAPAFCAEGVRAVPRTALFRVSESGRGEEWPRTGRSAPRTLRARADRLLSSSTSRAKTCGRAVAGFARRGSDSGRGVPIINPVGCSRAEDGKRFAAMFENGPPSDLREEVRSAHAGRWLGGRSKQMARAGRQGPPRSGPRTTGRQSVYGSPAGKSRAPSAATQRFLEEGAGLDATAEG